MDKKIIVLIGIAVLLYFFIKRDSVTDENLLNTILTNDIYDPEGTIDFSTFVVVSDLTFVERGTRVRCPAIAEYCKAKLYRSSFGVTKYIHTYTLKPNGWKTANSPYYIELYVKYALATTTPAITTTTVYRYTRPTTPTYEKEECGFVVEKNCEGENCINFVFVHMYPSGSYYYVRDYFPEQKDLIIDSADAFTTHRNKINFYAIYDTEIRMYRFNVRDDSTILKDVETFVLDKYPNCPYYKLIGIIPWPRSSYASWAWMDGSVVSCATPSNRGGYYTCVHELGHAFGMEHPFDCNRNPNKLPVCQNGQRTYDECDALCCALACKWCGKPDYYHFSQVNDNWISQKLSESLS